MLLSSLLSALLILVSVPAHAGFRERATTDGFAAYARSYSNPQLIETNSAALDARLKLLDMAPRGARARISSYEFLNGEATRRLARHVCLAATRGVRVELLVDGKYGDRSGYPDALDNSEESQIAYELYQYMANCGAQVELYNHTESFISVLGFRLPNIFGDPALNGHSVNPLKVLGRLNAILDTIGNIGNEELQKEGVKSADLRPLLRTIRNVAFEVMQFSTVLKQMDEYGSYEPANFDGSVERFQNLYAEILGNPAWDKIPSAKFKPALSRILARLQSDPAFHTTYEVLRRYNRIQHRKLFIVESGFEGCLIMGGRNLGDPYLTDGPGTFIDGDVLLCRNQPGDAGLAVTDAIESFENLKNDRNDGVLKKSNDLAITTIQKNPNFHFSYLLFPAPLAPRGLQSAPYRGRLSPEKRTLLPEREWRDEKPVLGEAAFENGQNWHVLRANWNPAEDQVRSELIRRINNETQQVYIESAYAEFGPDIRAAIESALARGVRVHLVTNSFFQTDGISKIIRPFMAPWMQRTQEKFGKLFQVRLTTTEAGHMIHLKDAAFACQKSGGLFVRSYLLGSHNFDPRGGRSDKENSLSWEEPISSCSDSAGGGLELRRRAFFQSLSNQLHTPVLAEYADFHAEIESPSIEQRFTHDTTLSNSWGSRALRQIFFLEGERTVRLNHEARVNQVLRVAEQGGLMDLIGLLF
ncbi:MAG: phospholipase D-like domain-containing protein [Bdellovibrionota bacterium]